MAGFDRSGHALAAEESRSAMDFHPSSIGMNVTADGSVVATRAGT